MGVKVSGPHWIVTFRTPFGSWLGLQSLKGCREAGEEVVHLWRRRPCSQHKLPANGCDRTAGACLVGQAIPLQLLGPSSCHVWVG
jgi:hypothetical protein